MNTVCPVELPEVGTLVAVKVGTPSDPHRKAVMESTVWTFRGAEVGPDGEWYAVLTREVPESEDDVWNGSGKGRGTRTLTERAKLT